MNDNNPEGLFFCTDGSVEDEPRFPPLFFLFSFYPDELL